MTTTDTTGTDEFEPRDWIYGGKRLRSGDRLYDLLIDATTGKESYWTLKKAMHAVGGIYAIPTNTDASLIRASQAVYSGVQIDDSEQVLELVAKSRAAQARHSQIRASKNAAKQDQFQEAMEPLRTVARTMRTGADKDAFIARVMRDLMATW